MMRVPVKPELLRWARDRSQRDPEYLDAKFPKLPEWEAGEAQPTLKQVESFARATYTPVGYFFLSTPPEEKLPIPDFRTVPGKRRPPSPNLLDMIYACQQRQEWYRTYARTMGEEPLPFVGSATTDDDPVRVAADIRKALGFDVAQRASQPSWTEALRLFISQADAAGILVMVSGIVLNNTHRALDPEEFRGFALSDPLAPLVFINGADTKAAQMFTLAHELAHIWLGASALSDAQALRPPDHEVERWCHHVASAMGASYACAGCEIDTAVPSMIVRRVGARFARPLLSSTLEGSTTFSEAFRLMGMKKVSSFQSTASELGIA